MGTYFVCYNYTDQGILSPGSSRKRFPLLKQSIADMGGELIGFYLTMGMFDTIAIVRFPNDETVAHFALSSTTKGYVKTVTMKAFTAEEYLDIISDLPGSEG
jgi:uncharacterized protein with GYD domain